MNADVTDREHLDELEALVSQWLPLPDVAELLGTDISRVRRMIDDRLILAVRRGEPRVLSVPRELVDPEPIPEVPGTVSVLQDGGYSLAEALRWLLTDDPTLPGTPLANLRAGRKTEVRRRAQALAF
ncbi:MAG TPA: Rv2175c family DNA-binding protein [Actinomycetales bacterium]|nr:Rv2175c family DNA-binding protein [Actinomycetales bacterium]